MVKHDVKNEPGYEKGVKYDEKAILAAAKRSKRIRKTPTSVALGPELVREMKEAAEEKGIPIKS